jgi:hypothetical protein
MSPTVDLTELYLPSSGSEGMDFEGWWCEGGNGCVCRHYVHRKAGYTDCTRGILIHQHGLADAGDRSTWHKAWRYVDGRPTCTAFRMRGGSLKGGRNERERYERALRGEA